MKEMLLFFYAILPPDIIEVKVQLHGLIVHILHLENLFCISNSMKTSTLKLTRKLVNIHNQTACTGDYLATTR